MNRLVYITNTRVPSEKANTYQSFQMCNSFAKEFDSVDLWVPTLKNTKEMNSVKDPYIFYGVEKTFTINKMFTIDSTLLNKIYQPIWALTKSIVFSFSVMLQLILNKKLVDDIIFTRDWMVLKFLAFAKRNGLLKNKIYFEAHKFSKHMVKSFTYIDGLVTINSYLKTMYANEGVQNIFVAHDGVNLETFKTMPLKEAKNVLDFDNKYKYLTYIGRFSTLNQEKGIPDIIKAFSKLNYVEKHLKLLFIGGPMKNVNEYISLEKTLKVSHGYIDYLDRQPVSELYKYLAASHILLMPFPYTEHYAKYMSPLKLFEYMAAKRPIIASNLPSICEVLEDKKNAILCNPDDPEDLAEKINWVLENDCTDIVQNAFEDVQKYTWDKRAKNIMEFMKNESD